MCTSALSLWWAPRLPPISSNPKKSHDKHLYGPTGYIFQSFSQVREHVHAQSQQLPDCFPEWQSQLRHSLQKCPRVPSSHCTIISLLIQAVLDILKQKLRTDAMGHQELSKALPLWVPWEVDAAEELGRNEWSDPQNPKMQHICILWEVW